MSDPIVIDRPFAVFIQPDESGQWTAQVVGYELDNATCAASPEAAVYMAFDLLCCLADKSPKDVIASLDEEQT